MFNRKPKTTAAIMAGFTTTIDQLQDLAADCLQKEGDLINTIATARADLEATGAERMKADRIAAKLQSFLED